MIIFEKYIITSSIESINLSPFCSESTSSLPIILSGTEYVKAYPVAWSPWNKIYKREYLKKNNLRFVENARFEDIDYSIKATILAKKVVFLSLKVYCYVCVGDSTVTIGNDSSKIEEYLMASVRLKEIVTSVDDEEVVKAIMVHYDLMMSTFLKTILWRMSYGEIVSLLTKYRLSEHSCKKIIRFTYKYPRLYALLAASLRPVLSIVLCVKKKKC